MAVSAVKKETATPQDAAAALPVSPKKNRKLLKLLIIFSVVAGLGGAGGYWYLQHNKSKKPAAAMAASKPPVFVLMEPFTVNLQLEDNPQFLQIGLSLKVADNTVVDALKLHMPDVRDRVLLLLSARKASELLSVEGKRKLSNDIIAAINAILAPAPAAPAKAETGEAKPAAEGEAAAPAQGEEKPAEETAASAAEAAAPIAAAAPILSVLFTSFIIQ